MNKDYLKEIFRYIILYLLPYITGVILFGFFDWNSIFQIPILVLSAALFVLIFTKEDRKETEDE